LAQLLPARRAKRAGFGRAQARNIFFGHVRIRDAAAAGEEKLGRCAAEQS
jgi:hypothetical protein